MLKKNYNSFDSVERKNEFKKLKASLTSQQNSFHRDKNISENATFASYEVAHLIAKHGKPFSDGEFVKECPMKVVGRVNMDKMDDFNNVRVSKTIQLGDVMEVVVKTVNVTRARGLSHREFQAFLSELDAEYGDVVYHSAVRWLSRGNVLKRFYSLRSERDQFLKAENQPIHELSRSLKENSSILLIE